MTGNEQDKELASAIREYSDNKGKLACLRHRFEAAHSVLDAFLKNPDNAKAQNDTSLLKGDLELDARNFVTLRRKQDRLRELFRAHNLDIS